MNNHIYELTILRTVVAYLGEVHQYGWWDSQFLGEIGLDYLKYNFPRTYHVAGVQGALESAKKVHDTRIGRAQVRHLFRLGNSVDKLIHEQLMALEPDDVAEKISSKESAWVVLDGLAARKVQAPEGPVQIGKPKDIVSSDGVVELAAHYLSGFEQQQVVLPYFGAG